MLHLIINNFSLIVNKHMYISTGYCFTSALIQSFELQHVSCDELLRDQPITRVYAVLSFAEETLRHMPESDVHHFSFLIMHERRMHLRHTPNVVPLQSSEGRRGRTKYLVNLDLVELLRNGGYSWQHIADVFRVSRTTLWRQIIESGMPINNYTDISDSDLDTLVSDTQMRFPNMGLRLLHRHLSSTGIKVQRSRLRASVQHVDPLQSIARWHQPISRRTYSVAGPNSLGHIDGHHSLVRWRFVVHGCIDGFSHLITYFIVQPLKLSLICFGKPQDSLVSHLAFRSDKGGENYKVCYYMIATQVQVKEVILLDHRHIISKLKGYGEMYIDVYAHNFTQCFTPLKQSAFLIQAMKLMYMYLFCTVCSYQKSNVLWMDF